VDLDQVAHDGEPSPRPPCIRVLELSAGGNGRTRGQEIARDSHSGVGGDDFDVTVRAPQLDGHLALPGVNLMALERRFHTTCCKRSGSP